MGNPRRTKASGIGNSPVPYQTTQMVSGIPAQFSGLPQIKEAVILILEELIQLADTPINASRLPFRRQFTQLCSLRAPF